MNRRKTGALLTEGTRRGATDLARLDRRRGTGPPLREPETEAPLQRSGAPALRTAASTGGARPGHLQPLPPTSDAGPRNALRLARLEAGAEPDVDELVARAAAGDKIAFAELYLRYFDRIYRYLAIALKNPADAEETAQHVFLLVQSAMHRYRPGRQPFRNWLFTIVKHEALKRLDKLGHTVPRAPSELTEELARDETRVAAGPTGWSLDGDLRALIDELPAGQRRVITLRYVHDLSHRQIAQALGSNERAVCETLRRALHNVARQIAPRHRISPAPAQEKTT